MVPDAIFMHAGTRPDTSVGPWATAAMTFDYQPSQTYASQPTTLLPDWRGPHAD